jgi:hypothetical protein
MPLWSPDDPSGLFLFREPLMLRGLVSESAMEEGNEKERYQGLSFLGKDPTKDLTSQVLVDLHMNFGFAGKFAGVGIEGPYG